MLFVGPNPKQKSNQNKWRVIRAQATTAIRAFSSQRDAIQYANPLGIKNHEDVVIQRPNGQFRSFKENIINYPLLLNGDCIVEMKKIQDHSIDLIATDLPYGTTQNKWDEIIPFNKMWEQFNRILTPKGIIVLTAAQPFSSKLVMSNPDNFKYEIIWEKTIGSGQLNIKKQPLRVHESILIFYNQSGGTYNEQKTIGEPYSINRKINFKGEGYGKQTNSSKENDGFRHARSIIKVSNPRIKNGHPTQKPLELMEYIIKTFSNEDDLVLDCCMGSGTTGEAAISMNRKFIGIELDTDYFNTARSRIKQTSVRKIL